VERLRHQIKNKTKALQKKQGIPTKIKEAGTLNKVHLLSETENLK
jgi:hypothetical protein